MAFCSLQVIVSNPVDMMSNCYGSHVLRSLLCLCGGVPLDSPEFHGVKPSTILAERLNLRENREVGNDSVQHQQGFPSSLKVLVSEMLKCTREDIKTLLVDQYSSLVLQACLNFPLTISVFVPSLLGWMEKREDDINWVLTFSFSLLHSRTLCWDIRS